MSINKRELLTKATVLGPEFVNALSEALQREYLSGLADGTTRAVEKFHGDITARCGQYKPEPVDTHL